VGWRFEKERKRLKGKLSSRDLSLSQQKWWRLKYFGIWQLVD
jgi:hypothetical protein